MKLHLLTRYSPLGASSRLRFFQFVPFLLQSGIDTVCSSFFDDGYLQNLYAGKKRQLLPLFSYYRSRWKYLRSIPDGDPLIIEYELLPHLPYCVEKYFLKHNPYILNFDDAVDLHYQKLPVLKNKYPQLIARAAGVIVANDLLLEKFSRYNTNIVKMPTIPPESIRPGTEKNGKLTLVWTGTPVTAKFLDVCAEALQQAAETVDFELLIVGSDRRIPGVNCRNIPWSEENEVEALQQAHAGIMPLTDTPFARGKSAYKLICYLRAGIPGIASPVGENCKVIRQAENGFLVQNTGEWVTAIRQLADPVCREKLSSQAKIDAAGYELKNHAQMLTSFIAKAMKQAKDGK